MFSDLDTECISHGVLFSGAEISLGVRFSLWLGMDQTSFIHRKNRQVGNRSEIWRSFFIYKELFITMNTLVVTEITDLAQ